MPHHFSMYNPKRIWMSDFLHDLELLSDSSSPYSKCRLPALISLKKRFLINSFDLWLSYQLTYFKFMHFSLLY